MKRNQSKFLALAFLAAVDSSHGAIFWQNLGNAGSGSEQNGGSLAHAITPTYVGSVGSVECTCNYQGSGVRYHSEWGPNGDWNTGTVYFGYALYLPTTFQFTGSQRSVTEQYGTYANGEVLVPDYYQAWVGGGNPSAYQFTGINGSDETSGIMTTGAWHTIVTEVTYGSGGGVSVWFDGNFVWTENGTISGGGGGNPGGNWALGLYEADWDGGNTGNGTNVTVYNAAATIASTYAEANPATYGTGSGSSNGPALSTATWTGGGAPDGNWQTAANWGGVAPAPGESLVFGGGSQFLTTNNFPPGAAFDGIIFTNTLAGSNFTLYGNSILLSGATNGNTNGIYNTTNLAETVNNNLALDWGVYSINSLGGGLNLNGTLTANLGGLADFGSSDVASTSLTLDETGLIAGLGGGGTIGNNGTGGGFSALATISGGNISSYTYSGGNIISSAGAIGATTQAAASNLELTATTAGSYTQATSSGNTYINTVLLTEGSSVTLVVGSDDSGTIVVGTTNVGTGMYVGGFYLPNGQSSQEITVGAGSGCTLTAGPMTGNPVPGEIIFAINGDSTSNEGENNASTKDNGSGGKVTVVKTGTGSMYVANPNTYSGGTYIDQGYLQINNSAGLGTGPVYIASGAELYLQASSGNWANSIYISPGVGPSYNEMGAIKIGNGSSTMILSGTLNLLGTPVTSAPGDRIGASGSGGTVELTGQITGTGTLELQANAANASYLIMNGAANPNNWTGGLIIDNAGSDNSDLKLGASNQLASNSVIVAQTSTGYARLDLNGFSETIGGLTANSSALNEVVNFGSGTPTLTIGANNASATFASVIGEGGSGGNSLNIIKAGTGTQTLSGTNTYTGSTTISNGTLAVSGSIDGTGAVTVAGGTLAVSAAQTYTAATSVPGGILALSGSGAINSSQFISVTNGTLDVSGLSGAFAYPNSIYLSNSTFKLGSVLASSINNFVIKNSTLALVLDQASASVAAGSLIADGATNIITFDSIPGFNSYGPGVTQFPLIQYGAGTFLNVDSNNNLTNLFVNLPAPGNPVGYLTNNTINNSIDLVLLSGPPLIEPITWTGQSNNLDAGNWDILLTPDWLPTGSNAPSYFYQDGSQVTFDDTLRGTTNVNLTTTISPASITVNNTHSNYLFSGMGDISGATGLTKRGAGTAVFAETGGDDFTGGITMGGGTLIYTASGAVAVSGGVANNAGTLVLDEAGSMFGTTSIAGGATLQVGDNDTNGSLPSGPVTNNGALIFNRTDSFTTASVISGTGTVANNGTGRNSILATNSYTGATAINAGTVLIDNYAAFGTPSITVAGGAVTIASGASLDVSGVTADAAPGVGIKMYNIAGTGVNGVGAIVNNGANANGFLHGLNNVTLTANATIGGTNNDLLPGTVGNSGHGRIDIGRDITAGSTLNLNGFTLTKIGNNMLNFAQYLTATTAGDIVCNGGVFSIDVGASIFRNTSAGSYIILDTNSILETYETPAGSVLTPIVFNGSGITAGETAGSATGTINSPIFMNNAVTFVERNGTTTGTVLLAGPIANVSSALSATLAANNSLPAVPAGAGSIALAGTATITLTLTGANTYTGPTTVSLGTLALSNSGSIPDSVSINILTGATLNASGRTDGTLTLANGQTLEGGGKITGALTSSLGSTVAPGSTSATGTLTVSGAVTLQGTTFMKLSPAGSTNDVLAGSSITYGGTLSLGNLSGAYAAGETFKLFNASTYHGSFANLTPAIPATGLAWQTNNLAITGTLSIVAQPTAQPHFSAIVQNGNNLVISGTNGVPNWMYYVLTSTNLSVPLSEWNVAATNTFNGAGNFNFTNSQNSNSAQTFYLLKLQY